MPTRTSSSSAIQEPSLVWYPSLGLRVIYAQSFPRLLTPSDVDITIVYHRYDYHWADWELHVWTNSTEHYPAFTTKLTATRPHIRGQIVFHLIGYVFPYKTQIYAEPVRMKLHPAQTTVNDFGHTIVGEPYRDACRRDVVREWTSAQPPSQILHFVQGDSNIYVQPPESQLFRSKRWFRVRYRRFLPSDYDGWDLWSWDAVDPITHRVALKPVSETRAWVDFVVDRACYGGAGSICLLPRRGGDAWLEKDGAERVWNASLLGNQEGLDGDRLQCDGKYDHLPTFIISQQTKFILRSLDDVKCMMDAYVDGEHSIVVTTPVPGGWISPPKTTGQQPSPDITVKLCQRSVQSLLSDGKQSHDRIGGRVIRFRKCKQLSHTQMRLLFDESVTTFHEDFLVENVIVSVPPFDAVCLHWEKHEDEDKYLYKGSLGWAYSVKQCIFRCFAPAADQVSVVLYDKPTGDAGRVAIPMRRIPQGCWKLTVAKNLKGMFYKLLAEGKNKRLFPGVEVIDPYSRCNTSHTGRGLIYGTDTTPICERPKVSTAEIIVYELHVRDVTIDKLSGIRNGGKFLGLAERGTKLKLKTVEKQRKHLTKWEPEVMPGVEKAFSVLDKLSTGLDHIAQMGVTAIQIMPVQDFDNNEADDGAYRWGYMPVHFNSPGGMLLLPTLPLALKNSKSSSMLHTKQG
ncbi:Pullulanase Pul1 [Gracilaria domingensis]|nr:Pullulanase Pul1 [Gracilaria domingensis]